MKTKVVPSAAKPISKPSGHNAMMEKHIWAAVGASAFAIILSAVIAFNHVEAAPAKSVAPTGGNLAATKSDVERVMQRLGKIDRALEEIRMLVSGKKGEMPPKGEGMMLPPKEGAAPAAGTDSASGGTTEGAAR